MDRRAHPLGSILRRGATLVAAAGLAVVTGLMIAPVGSAAAADAASAPGWTAYVVAHGGDALIQIDTATNSTFGVPLAAGDGPEQAAITPDGKTAYVTDYNDNTVTPIDLATGVPGPSIAVGANPEGVAITPDGRTAFVANANGNSVTPIDTATNTPGSAIPVGTRPVAIAITPDGRLAYVVNNGSGTVTPVNVASRTPGGAIPVGSSPEGIAVAPNGVTAYVTNHDDNTVTPIFPSTGRAGPPIAVGGGPYGIAITPDGQTAYVTDFNGNSVTPIDLADDAPGAAISVGMYPSSAAVTPDGRTVYVTNFNDGTVTPITTATNSPGNPIPVGTYPEGTVVAPDEPPIPAFTATVGAPGQATSFDASTSTGSVEPIASYAWNFGDGQTTTTTTPHVSHVYAQAGSYTAKLTLTNALGTSLTQVFTGQTVSRNGGPQATLSRTITVAAPLTPAPVPKPPPPATLSGLHVTPDEASVAGRLVHGRCVKHAAAERRVPACLRPVALVLRFRLSKAAPVTVSLERRTTGHQVGKRCVAPRDRNRAHPHCIQFAAVRGRITRAEPAGLNPLALTTRFAGHLLGPGVYRLIVAPAGGTARTVRLTLTG